jgi:hypothetical protein
VSLRDYVPVPVLIFNSGDYQFWQFWQSFCDPLPASLSQKPHPAYVLLLQTNAKLQFDRAMTVRSKLFRGPLLGLFLANC